LAISSKPENIIIINIKPLIIKIVINDILIKINKKIIIKKKYFHLKEGDEIRKKIKCLILND
jgi:hypothetical protein